MDNFFVRLSELNFFLIYKAWYVLLAQYDYTATQ